MYPPFPYWDRQLENTPCFFAHLRIYTENFTLPNKRTTYHSQFAYDIIGNITRKIQTHKLLGTSSTQEPRETNYAYTYKYLGAQPHAVTDTEDKKYSYDQNGNMTGWVSKTANASRTIVWNEENRVKQVIDSGNGTSFLYDDAGERVVKGGGGNESVYLNRFYSLKNGSLGSKHVYAGETRIVTKLEKDGGSIQSGVPGSIAFERSQGLRHAIEQGSGTKKGIERRRAGADGGTTTTNPPIEKFQFFYHGDHLGSSSFITDDAGAVYQHLEYFPYGETWVEEGGSGQMPYYRFTGKELDPETGLYYYGARYYDPVLSRWISADPAIGKYLHRANGNRQGNTVYQPIALSLYAYAGLNPLIYRDPTGEELGYMIFAQDDVFTGTISYPMWDTKAIKYVSNIVHRSRAEGIPLKLGSGFRTLAQQTILWDLWQAKLKAQEVAVKQAYEEWYKSGQVGPINEKAIREKIMPTVYPASNPETGNRPHAAGLAIDTNYRDLTPKQQQRLTEIVKEEGFSPVSDPNELHHFQMSPQKAGYKSWEDAVNENQKSFEEWKEKNPGVTQ